MLTAVMLPFFAFALAIVGIMAVFLVVNAASRWPGRMFSWLMVLILSSSIGATILSGRVLRMEQKGLVVGREGDIEGTLVAKLLLATVIGCSVALCVALAVRFRIRKTIPNRFNSRGMRIPSDIIVSFATFYIAYNVLPLFFGQRYDFHVSLIYPFFVFLALLLWVQFSNIDPVIVMKRCLAAVVFGSLVAAVVAPTLALQPGYTGLIPGFDSRLWGVTPHANGLGAIACALLILEAAEPSTRAWLGKATFIAAAAALILSQSKTSIIAALVGLSVIFLWRILLKAGKEANVNSKNQGLFFKGMMGVFVVSILMVGAWAMFFDPALLAPLERKLYSGDVGDISTASGRTWIWTAAIRGGMESPLFGQGLSFWNFENRLRLGLGGAVNAHNLLLQAFSRAGLVGLVALLAFLYFLFRYSIRASSVTRGGSIAMASAFLVRAIFEVPLQPDSILGPEFFAMMAYLIYVMDRGARPVQKTYRRTAWQAHSVKNMAAR